MSRRSPPMTRERGPARSRRRATSWRTCPTRRRRCSTSSST
uniref:Uncharacterized protein n=1 Tax=Zea mays TaxID=4577 RepID=C4J7X2_MAIZE|nr:unknown [Zea mays]ACR37415.1 unknown [Zea mays]